MMTSPLGHGRSSSAASQNRLAIVRLLFFWAQVPSRNEAGAAILPEFLAFPRSAPRLDQAIGQVLTPVTNFHFNRPSRKRFDAMFGLGRPPVNMSGSEIRNAIRSGHGACSAPFSIIAADG